MFARWLKSHLGLHVVYCTFIGQVLLAADGGNTNATAKETPEYLPLSSEAEHKQVQAVAHYAVGIIQELDGNADAALAEFRLAAIADSSNETIVISLIQRLLERKKPDEALSILLGSTRNSDAPATLYAWLGVVYAQLGQNDQAIEALKEALKKSPLLTPAYQDLIRIQLQRGSFSDASVTFKAAINQDTADLNYYLELTGAFLAFRSLLGKNADEIKTRLLEKLDSTSKGSRSLLENLRLADFYRLLAQYSKSIEIYRRILLGNPDLPGLRESLADALLRSGDKKGAVEQLESLFAENPTNPQVCFLLGGLFLDMAANPKLDEDARMADYAKAVIYLEKTLKLKPNLREAYFELARAHLALRQSQKTLNLMQQVRTQGADKFLVEFFSGIASSELKRYEEAIKFLSAAEIIASVETNRPMEMVYFQLGAAYERNKQMDMAEKYFEKCLGLNPDSAEALNYMGYMWAEKGIKLSQAKEMIQKALKIDPDNPAYLDSMAWVLFKLSNFQDALPLMLKAISLNKQSDAVLYDHLGDIYQALGKSQLAIGSWKKSVEIEPNPEVQKKIQPVQSSEKSD